MVGRKPTLTREQYWKILRVVAAKRAIRKLPTWAELASEFGVSKDAVVTIAYRIRVIKRYEREAA